MVKDFPECPVAAAAVASLLSRVRVGRGGIKILFVGWWDESQCGIGGVVVMKPLPVISEVCRAVPG